MAVLIDKATASFKVIKLLPLATASKAGNPNVTPMGVASLHNPDTIWIGDSYVKDAR